MVWVIVTLAALTVLGMVMYYIIMHLPTGCSSKGVVSYKEKFSPSSEWQSRNAVVNCQRSRNHPGLHMYDLPNSPVVAKWTTEDQVDE